MKNSSLVRIFLIVVILLVPFFHFVQSQNRNIELFDLVNIFTPDKALNYNLYDWNTGANKSQIQWLSNGIEMGDSEFYRNGEAVVSISGKTISCLEKRIVPCKWQISLTGSRNGYTSFSISSINSQELEIMTIEKLFSGQKFVYKLISQDDDCKIYKVSFPNKKPIKMVISWSCGSAGCSLNIECKTQTSE